MVGGKSLLLVLDRGGGELACARMISYESDSAMDNYVTEFLEHRTKFFRGLF